MSCLNNLISIKGYCEDNNDALIYLDDIDITMPIINSYIGNEHVNVKSFIDSKINAASMIMAADINTIYANQYTNSSYISNARIGYEQQNMQIVNGINQSSKGIYVELCNLRSNVDFYVSRISLFTDYTGDVNVYVWDVIQDKLIDIITINCVANQISIKQINKKYTSQYRNLRLLFIYDSTSINSYQTNYSDNICGGCANQYLLNNFVRAYGAVIENASQKINNNIIISSDTGGMSLTYSLNCNYIEWMCDLGNLLALPLAYKAAAEIERYALDTNRFNDRAGNKEARIKERLDYYELRYRELFDGIIYKMMLPADDICFRCNERIKSRIILP